MSNKLLLLIIIFSISFHSNGKNIKSLEYQINSILKDKRATVGVAILSSDLKNSLSINGNLHLPLQSVFKFHLAIAVLDQVDKGKLSLLDNINITPKDLDNNLWSPIRKKYPKGAKLTLAEVIKYTVASSDNVGCDVLFRILGGVKVVEAYFHQAGIVDIAIEYDEETQQKVFDRQYKNWITANTANLTLKVFYENSESLLSPDSHHFLWNTMKSSRTGKNSIKGGLPKGTVVAHKTGHSGKNDSGLTGAQNDIGIIFLPNNNYFYLSVLVSDSLEAREVNQKIIADIAKLTWAYFKNN